MVADTKTQTLFDALKSKILPDSVVYTDSYRSYDILDVSDFKHYRIKDSKLFVDKQNHINGIENFWNQAKRVLRKYNEMPQKELTCQLRCIRSNQQEGIEKIAFSSPFFLGL